MNLRAVSGCATVSARKMQRGEERRAKRGEPPRPTFAPCQLPIRRSTHSPNQRSLDHQLEETRYKIVPSGGIRPPREKILLSEVEEKRFFLLRRRKEKEEEEIFSRFSSFLSLPPPPPCLLLDSTTSHDYSIPGLYSKSVIREISYGRRSTTNKLRQAECSIRVLRSRYSRED